MSDSINPVGLGTAVVAGAIAGAVTPAIAKGAEKVAQKVMDKNPKVDAFVKNATEKATNAKKTVAENLDKAVETVKETAKKVVGKVVKNNKNIGDISQELPGVNWNDYNTKTKFSTKVKSVFGKIADSTVQGAKWVNKNILTPIGKTLKNPIVAGAVLFGVAFLVLSKLLNSNKA